MAQPEDSAAARAVAPQEEDGAKVYTATQVEGLGRCAVTGGLGYTGSVLVQRLVAMGGPS